MPEFSRIRVGENYAIRNAEGTLTETGWIDEDGVAHKDSNMDGSPKIDGSSPAAMVPWNQRWS